MNKEITLVTELFKCDGMLQKYVTNGRNFNTFFSLTFPVKYVTSAPVGAAHTIFIRIYHGKFVAFRYRKALLVRLE